MGPKRIRQISQAQEEKVAEDLDGRVQAASGALRLGGGGDVRVMGSIRAECKFTNKQSYILKQSDLQKLRLQAIKGGLEFPVMQLAFRSQTGNMDKYAIMPWDDYLSLKEE